ncbi:histidine phosphatase family protein [Streptomyces sp. NPDC050095]|uniref:histidine phosphatase family protein n=1 Tax=unclassified Streptomyces TaxID=2593676 RepID=UPI00342E8F39
MPGGKSSSDVHERFDAVVAEAVSTGLESVALVSHGAVIRAWLAVRAVEVDVRFVRELELDNTGQGHEVRRSRRHRGPAAPVRGQRAR